MARWRTAGRGSPSRLDEIDRRQRLPGQLQPARVVDLGRALAADPVDAAQHVGLLKLRRRAAELVPAAGVDHEQAAVGVFEHVGRMEVEVGLVDEILVLGREASPRSESGRAG